MSLLRPRGVTPLAVRRITTRPVDEQGLLDALDNVRHNDPNTAAAAHARAFVDVELAIWQMNMNEQAGRDLSRATWVLACATIALVVSTIGLIAVTAGHT
jgi:hypothetical protein